MFFTLSRRKRKKKGGRRDINRMAGSRPPCVFLFSWRKEIKERGRRGGGEGEGGKKALELLPA